MTIRPFGTCRDVGVGAAVVGAVLVAAVLALPGAAAAQDGAVTGTVTDAASQRPVSSVQAVLVGTSLGTLSRDNGRFVILNVPAGEYTLRLSRIGYAAMEAQITVVPGRSTEQDFAIAAQALGLDEIVVTGTAGAARRREVGNAITQLDVDKDVVGPPSTSTPCSRPGSPACRSPRVRRAPAEAP